MPVRELSLIVEEARRIVRETARQDATIRLLGGTAVALRAPSAGHRELRRDYEDIDLIARAKDRPRIVEIFTGLGYVKDATLNPFHSHGRMWFKHVDTGWKLDVFFDRVTMCHELELGGRLELDEETVTLADLLLLKLQVVETTEKDFKDATAIFADCELGDGGIDVARITAVLGADWGWWRTATMVLDRVDGYAATVADGEIRERAQGRIAVLRDAIDAAPKSLRWRARAKIGDRKVWHELPGEET